MLAALFLLLAGPQPAAAVTNITLSSNVVNENEPGGTAVGTLQATNSDPSATHAFLLVADAGDDEFFALEGDLLRTAATFDHEARESYQIWIKATDNYGLIHYQELTIFVGDVNEAPVIVEGATASVTSSEDNSPTPFALTLNVSDIDNSSFSWAILTAPGNGAAAVSGNGTATASYTPDANYNGSDSFVVQVSDGKQSDSITVNVTVEAVNDAPFGADDSGTTMEETPVTIDVLANDSDAVEGGTLSLVDPGSPAHGVAEIIGGQIRYTPNDDFNGSDIFVYTFTDDGTPPLTATATVVVSVSDVNDAPVIGIVEEVIWEPVGIYGFSNPAFKGDLAGLAR